MITLVIHSSYLIMLVYLIGFACHLSWVSTPEPPYHYEKPENYNEKDNVPQKATPLSFCHVVHSPKRPGENAARLSESIVLFKCLE